MLTELFHPKDYMKGTRVLMLCGRYKDGAESTRRILRVSYSEEDFKDQYQVLLGNMLQGERIYASVSSRNTKKAIRQFREQQLAAEYDQFPTDFYKRLESVWISALMAPTSQEEKLWMSDCDDESQYKQLLSELKAHYTRTMQPYIYKSKNGWHVIIQPFDRNSLREHSQKLLHENALMLWAYSQ